MGALRRNTRVKIPKKKEKLSRGMPLPLSFQEKVERGQLGKRVGASKGIQRTHLKAQG